MSSEDQPSLSNAEDVATAFHEAGHAVVALYYDRPVHRVSIEPKQRTAGRCELRKGAQRTALDVIEAEILMALAGLVAEALFTGRYDPAGASQDLRYARKLMLSRTTEQSLERYERRMLSKVQNLLADDALVHAVKAIAKELLKQRTISGRAARHLYEQEKARHNQA